jgi:hypothetical protein
VLAGLCLIAGNTAVKYSNAKIAETSKAIGEIHIPSVTEKATEWKDDIADKAEENGLTNPYLGYFALMALVVLVARRLGIKIPSQHAAQFAAFSKRSAKAGWVKARSGVSKVPSLSRAQKRKAAALALVVAALAGYLGYKQYPEEAGKFGGTAVSTMKEVKEWGHTNSSALLIGLATLAGSYLQIRSRRGKQKPETETAVSTTAPVLTTADLYEAKGKQQLVNQVAQAELRDALTKLEAGSGSGAFMNWKTTKTELVDARDEFEEASRRANDATQEFLKHLRTLRQALQVLPPEEYKKYTKFTQYFYMLDQGA